MLEGSQSRLGDSRMLRQCSGDAATGAIDESFTQQQADLQAFVGKKGEQAKSILDTISPSCGRDFPRQVCVSLAVFQYIMDIRVVGYEAEVSKS